MVSSEDFTEIIAISAVFSSSFSFSLVSFHGDSIPNYQISSWNMKKTDEEGGLLNRSSIRPISNISAMGFLEILLQILQIIPLVWDTASQQLGYVKDLNSNVAILMRETRELKRKRHEFKEEVDDAESAGEKRLRRVNDWFNHVNKAVPEVCSIKKEFDRGTLNPFQQRKLGKRVLEKLKDVKKLNDEGVFDEVSKSPRQLLMQKMQDAGQLERESSCLETMEDRGQFSTNTKSGMFCVCGRPRRRLQFRQNGARGRAYKSVSTRPAANEGSSVEGTYHTISLSEPILQVDLQTLKQAVEQVCSNISTSSSLPTTPGSGNRMNS